MNDPSSVPVNVACGRPLTGRPALTPALVIVIVVFCSMAALVVAGCDTAAVVALLSAATTTAQRLARAVAAGRRPATA